jgi:hypothetical protein
LPVLLKFAQVPEISTGKFSWSVFETLVWLIVTAMRDVYPFGQRPDTTEKGTPLLAVTPDGARPLA